MKNYIDALTSIYKTTQYNKFVQKYTKHLTSQDSISLIEKIQLTKILDVFEYVFIHLTNLKYKTYKNVSMSISTIAKDTKTNNKLITFIIELLVELKMIKRISSKKMGVSNKYCLLSIDGTNEELIKITFNEKVLDVISKNIKSLNSNISRAKKNNKNTKALIDKLEYIKASKETIIEINSFNGISQEKFNETINQRNGRKQHFFSTFKKDYRDFLLLNNNPISSIDISNSQPAFLANDLILNNEMMQHDDVKIFTEECFKGNIYQYIANQLSIEVFEVKDLWMKIAYGLPYIKMNDDECTIINKIAEPFYKLFPNVLMHIDTIKNEDLTDKGRFAIYLQGLESKHINKMSNIINNNTIDHLTIYDEVLMEENNYNESMAIVQEYINETGLKLTFKNKIETTSSIVEEVIQEVKMIEEFDVEILTDKTLEKYKEFKGDREAIVGLIRNLTGHNKWSINDYYTIMDKVVTTRFHHIPLVKKENTLEKTIKYIL